MDQSTTLTAGIDIGDRHSHICVLDEGGEIVEQTRIATTKRALQRYFVNREPMLAAMEVGTHSPWISRLVEEAGHRPAVANARRLRLIYADTNKDDRLDAEKLARLARADLKLLMPIQHRGADTQLVLASIRVRDALVRARVMLVNSVRGQVKSMGHRLRKCSTESFHKRQLDLPAELRPVFDPLFATIQRISEQIKSTERELKQINLEQYPETDVLRQVAGVGPVTALAFVTTLEDPTRFRNGRAVAAYLGLTPRRHQSSSSDPQLRITKAGDSYLRSLLVGAANYVIGPFGPDTALRRWGLGLAARGGKAAKKRAIVAVARKLAVLLFGLWKTGEIYEPLRGVPNEPA